MLRFYFDEDVMVSAIIVALRTAGIDIVTVREAGMRGRDDPSQLTFAAEQQRTVVTSNIPDLARLHAAWMQEGRSHAGMVLVPQQHFGVGETIQRLVRLAHAFEPDGMVDRVEYLIGWG